MGALITGALFLILGVATAGAGEGESDVIRLGGAAAQDAETAPTPVGMSGTRRGFDYAAFETRLESLWFQRKTLLANGRDADSREQLEQIRTFCEEEGVKRIEHLSGALVAEAYRFRKEGNDALALSALEFAEAFDPGRPQVHVARAAVLWQSNAGVLPVAGQIGRALGVGFVRSLRDLSLPPRLVFVFGLAWLGAALVFTLLMLWRYQAPLRHEIEEWAGGFAAPPWPEVFGWILLALPLLTWVGTGWAALFWIVIAFRFMTRREKLTAACFLLSGMLAVPAYGLAVGLYGTWADPAVRATVTSVEGEYDPDRIVRLRQLVQAHPDAPAYHFLLAGVYKNGRYFEEAFDEYRKALELDPSFVAAHVNVGNILYTTGQYAAAINRYHNALALDSASFLAHFNLHLAQSEGFHFKEAESSLRQARQIDADRVARLLGNSTDYAQRSAVQDASLAIFSVWGAALEGRSPDYGAGRHTGATALLRPSQLLNGVTIVCLLALLACLGMTLAFRGSTPARRCIRCGRSCCQHCTGAHEAQEYCSQCLHLYVLRDGLLPETKAKKLYEVERHERRTRAGRRLLALLLPGAGHVLRSKTASGVLMLGLWFALLISAAPELLAPSAHEGLRLSSDLLLPPEVPTRFDSHAGRYLAVFALLWVWLAGNWSGWRAKEV